MTGSYTYTFDDIRNRPVAVIGSGTLGRRIALMFASRGGTVRMYARRAEQHAEATQYVAETLPKLLQDRGFGEIGVAVGTSSLEEALDGAWLAVESVPERLEIKIPLWGQIDQAALPDTIFATNSSSFPSPEPVKPFETCQAACSVSVFSFGGSLIQAASGSLGGAGLRRNRSGFAA